MGTDGFFAFSSSLDRVISKSIYNLVGIRGGMVRESPRRKPAGRPFPAGPTWRSPGRSVTAAARHVDAGWDRDRHYSSAQSTLLALALALGSQTRAQTLFSSVLRRDLGIGAKPGQDEGHRGTPGVLCLLWRGKPEGV